MAQRARRMPVAPGAELLRPGGPAGRGEGGRARACVRAEPRRAAKPPPRRALWSHRGVMALGAAAAMAFMFFGVAQARPVSSLEEPWSQEVLASGLLQACVDTERRGDGGDGGSLQRVPHRLARRGLGLRLK